MPHPSKYAQHACTALEALGQLFAIWGFFHGAFHLFNFCMLIGHNHDPQMEYRMSACTETIGQNFLLDNCQPLRDQLAKELELNEAKTMKRLEGLAELPYPFKGSQEALSAIAEMYDSYN